VSESEFWSAVYIVGAGIAGYAILSRGLLILFDPMRLRWCDSVNTLLADATLTPLDRSILEHDKAIALTFRGAWSQVFILLLVSIRLLSRKARTHEREVFSGMTLHKRWPSYPYQTAALQTSGSIFAFVLFWSLLILVVALSARNRDDIIIKTTRYDATHHKAAA
jgi:hypothetical protein